MAELKLSPFTKYIDVLAPLAIAIESLGGENGIYYGELLPNLLSVENKLANLLKYYWPLQSFLSGFL